MRPKIDREPTFDPLQLFTSEGPVEGVHATNRPDTRWRPTFVPMIDVRSPVRRLPRAARFGFVAAASLAGGILVGFASGYLSAQRLIPAAAIALRSAVPSARTGPSSVAGRPLPVDDAVKPAPESRESHAASGALTVGSPTPSAPAGESAPESRQFPVGPQPQSAVDREPAGVAGEPRGPVATSLRAREGTIEVLSRPAGADVALDGRIVGQTPVTIPSVEEGTHVIGIELSGFSRWATSVRVEAGKPTRVGASLTP